MENPLESNPKSEFNLKPEMNIKNISAKPPERGRFWQIASVVVILHIAALGTLVLFQSCSKNEPPPLTENDSTFNSTDELAHVKEVTTDLGQSPTASLPNHDALTPEEHLASNDDLMSPSTSEGIEPKQEPGLIQSEKVAQSESVTKPLIETGDASTPKKAASSAVEKVSSSKQYVVRKGDTLSKIAKKYKLSVSHVANMNNINAKAPLKIGQKLMIPTTAKIEMAKTLPVTPVPVTSKGSSKTHIIKSGESPISIAKRYGVSVQSLLRVNHITDPKKIRVNQKLVIPTAASTKVVAPFVTPKVEDLRPTATVETVDKGLEIKGI